MLFDKGEMKMLFQKTRWIMVVSGIIVFILLLTSCNNTYGDKHDPGYNSLPKEEERYYVMLSDPLENQIYVPTDPPPRFTWTLHKGLPETFVIEIDYLNDASLITDNVFGRTNYKMSDELWERIKNNAPIVDGKQKICWRIRIDYTINPEEGPYYSAWGTFWIDNVNNEN